VGESSLLLLFLINIFPRLMRYARACISADARYYYYTHATTHIAAAIWLSAYKTQLVSLVRPTARVCCAPRYNAQRTFSVFSAFLPRARARVFFHRLTIIRTALGIPSDPRRLDLMLSRFEKHFFFSLTKQKRTEKKNVI